MYEEYYRWPEYQLIKDVYGTNVAKRSGVPLMNHIYHGLGVMTSNGASEVAMKAYCLHPVVQSNKAFESVISPKDGDEVVIAERLKACDINAIMLALEYRKVANSYLCTPLTDSWSKEHAKKMIGWMHEDTRQMLIADKVQNRQDFMIHHWRKHDRSSELFKYFHNWLDILGYVEPIHTTISLEAFKARHANILGVAHVAVGPGWIDILNTAFDELQKLEPAQHVTQVKEKFGGLRIYGPRGEAADKIVADVMQLAETTCDICGGHAHVETYAEAYWVRTRCPIHKDTKPDVY